MKYLSLILCFFGLCVCQVRAQTATTDTVVYGNVQNNYPGGQEAYNKYLEDSVTYPSLALRMNLMGCVYLQFIIETDGSLSHVKVFRGIGSGADEASVSALKKSGNWLPSKVNGSFVRTKCRAVINYVLKPSHGGGVYGTANGTPTNPAVLLEQGY